MTNVDLGPFPQAEGYETAQALDREDKLADHRNNYVITDPDLIYLDGNSLGRLHGDVQTVVEDVVTNQWGDRLIRSWNEGWWELQLRLGDQLGSLLGASKGEVIISDSTSVNLYKMALSALRSQPGRNRIITDDLNFPSDLYVLKGIAQQTGHELRIVESDGVHGPLEELEAEIDESTALVSLSHVAFKSGYAYDMRAVTELGRQSGALTLWDCSHSAGAVELALERDAVDLAVGCTYKYLNGGPGSPAFIYVTSSLQNQLRNPITGWWGHAEPFKFDHEFKPVDGIRRFHSGTMPVLSLAALEPGLSDIADAGPAAIRSKSVALTEYLISQWTTHLRPLGFELASPMDPNDRGSHISLGHPNAWPITRALIERGNVIPDFRVPDNLRLGLSPLYTRFLDVHTALQRLRNIVESGAHKEFDDARAVVT